MCVLMKLNKIYLKLEENYCLIMEGGFVCACDLGSRVVELLVGSYKARLR